ncbi:hypothetical protein ACWF5H_03870 [Arthrobacter sp. NPDC055138]
MDDGGASFGQMRPVDGTDPEGRAALAILQMLQDVEPWLGRGEAAVEPGSPLAQLDEQFTAAQSVSSLLRQSLAAATDNVLALRRLLFEEHGGHGPAEYRLQTHAPYSLVRTVIECTSTVLWALLPSEGPERARGSLVLIARDVFNAASFWDAYLADFRPERHARAMEYFSGLRRTVNEVAESLELPPIFARKADNSWGYATKNRTQTSILKDLRTEDLPPSLMYVWQFCSGHSHGLEWAAVGGARYPDPFSESGTSPFRAGSMEQLRQMCDVSLGLVPRAWDVFDTQRRVWPVL